ncbi:unnamed protein product [Ectocarpus sp. 12 AP-2014]
MHEREAQRQREWRAGGTCRRGLCAAGANVRRQGVVNGHARSYRRLEHALDMGEGRQRRRCV